MDNNHNDIGKKINKRLFLIGCPRSGTTLLQSMLMAHPRIHSFPETHFFDRGFGGTKSQLLKKTFRGYYLWFLLMLWRTRLKDVEEIVPRIKPHFKIDTMVDHFVKTLDTISIRHGCDIWVEKTPRHIRFIETIVKYIPQSEFIHMFRDGRAVVASLYSVSEDWGHSPAISDLVERWNETMRISVLYKGNSRHHYIDYEGLVSEPEKALNNLCISLELEYSLEMLNYPEKAKMVVTEKEKWKENAFKKLSNPGLSKYDRIFDAHEKAVIEDNLIWDLYREIRN